MVQKPESDIEPKERRIDLSLPQVAGSAVAAVAAAVAASQLGVYGTIMGAGVMSVVATCGGSVFQHFFRRTGEQIREVTVQVKHPDREVTVHTRQTRDAGDPDAEWETAGTRIALREAAASAPTTAIPRPADATTVLGRVDPADADATRALRRVDATTVLRQVPADAERTRQLRAVDGTRPLAVAPADQDDAFSSATTHGTRIRGWKRSALGAAVVFVVAMVGITTFELLSGNDLSGGQGTTVGSVVRGERGSGGSTDPQPTPGTGTDRDATTPAGDGSPAPTAPRDGGSTRPGPRDSGAATDAPTPTPAPSDGTGSGTGGGAQPSATPTPSATGDGASPAPSDAGSAPAQEGDPATGDTGR
ncbi:hypothetical protein [Streptomyces sp. NPDC057682]|uniref:hypothetical protein n=1 Tax=Streptomyces sp. NPDC057682 TaxID=3346210 RepID=UPI0036A90AA8